MKSGLTCDEGRLRKLAEELADWASPEDVFCLEGGLGAGKTTFAKHFIKHLCGEEVEVTSPTFSIAHCYTTKDNVPLWHFDLYRLESISELYEIGIEEALSSGISLVEWPELASSLIDRKKAKLIKISFSNKDNERVVQVTDYK